MSVKLSADLQAELGLAPTSKNGISRNDLKKLKQGIPLRGPGSRGGHGTKGRGRGLLRRKPESSRRGESVEVDDVTGLLFAVRGGGSTEVDGEEPKNEDEGEEDIVGGDGAEVEETS